MRGVILKEIDSGYFTDMRKIFDALGNAQLDYNWLLTDYECNHYPTTSISYNQEYVWLDGQVLTQIVTNHAIQFIWGVFSGFPKLISSGEALRHKLPFADCNPDFWHPSFDLQHPMAEIEIVSWDSSFVLLMSRSDALVHQFQKAYPQAIDLSKYNAALKQKLHTDER